MNFFGKAAAVEKVDPAESAKQWKRQLQKEARNIDKDIERLKREEQKSLKECKKLAKEGYLPAARILAKEIVNTRKATTRMYAAKAQLNSVSMFLQTSVCKWLKVHIFQFKLIYLYDYS